MSNWVQFLVHPLPGSQEQLTEKLREVAERLSRQTLQPGSGSSSSTAATAPFALGASNPLNNLGVSVRQIEVGPSHFAFLLQDGRVCRLPFSVISDRLDLTRSSSSAAAASTSKSVSKASTTAAPTTTSTNRQPARTRGRIIRTSSIRGGRGGIIMSSNRPAPYVPEELVSQAQSVLQGRSRQLIIRELQRTNLDVNLAVNNLLSR